MLALYSGPFVLEGLHQLLGSYQLKLSHKESKMRLLLVMSSEYLATIKCD
jgi:hypothetical protein